MKLPEKIFIREIVQLPGFRNTPEGYVMQSLINEVGITTYFDVNVFASESTGYEMQPINQDGDELPYVNGAPPTHIEGPGKKILEAEVEEGGGLYVFRFEHDGKKYCGADNEGTNLQPIRLDPDSIYFDRSDFGSDIFAKPDYLDEHSEYYAPELDFAIQLHKAIHIDKCGNQSQNRVARVTNWLDVNYSDQKFSNAEIERLSAIIRIVKPKKK